MQPKLCLPCARRKLGGRPAKPCGNCILLNVDPHALTRARAARPLFLYSPLHFAVAARKV